MRQKFEASGFVEEDDEVVIVGVDIFFHIFGLYQMRSGM